MIAAAAVALVGCGGSLGGAPPPGTGGAGGGPAGGAGGGPAGGPGTTPTGAAGAPICGATATLVEVSTTPEILLVVDRGAPAGVTSAALQAVTATDSRIAWGLYAFGAPQGCDISRSIVVVTPGLNNAGTITTTLGGTGSGGAAGASPIRVMENAAASYFEQGTDSNPHYLMLVADGAPTCPDGSTDPTADDSAGALAAVSTAYSAYIPTFIVANASPGTYADAAFVALANAGGMASSGPTPYYSPGTVDDLVSALETSVLPTVGCDLMLPTPPNSNVSNDIISIYDGNGVGIPRDLTHVDGWDYASPAHTSIRLYGQVCEAAISGALGSVTVTYHCLIE
jgi:hypothetical protein